MAAKTKKLFSKQVSEITETYSQKKLLYSNWDAKTVYGHE